MTRTLGDRTYRSASDACQAFLDPSYVCTGTFSLKAATRLAFGPRRPAAAAATMMRLETRNGTPEPPSSATQRWCGLLLGVVARTLRRRAARAGGVLKRPRLYDDVRDLCARPWHESRRRAGPVWARALILGPRLLWHRRAWRHTKRTKQGPFGFSEAPAICAQPCATDQIAKRRAALLQDQKLLHPILHCPAQVDNDATDGVSAGHLRPCCRLAARKAAKAIARRKAGTARRPRTAPCLLESRRHRRDGVSVEARERQRHRRNNMKRRAATPTARPARPSTRRRRSRTRTIRWIRS